MATSLRLLRIKEVAERTGLERWRLYELVAAGKIPHQRIGRTIRIYEQELAKWIEEQHRANTTTVEEQ